jgi:glycerophosphoryl diester phosphodiesterase
MGLEIAARMGADLIECDITFTKDLELVCRHDQCDLHTSTDVLLRPELAAKCSRDWTGPSPAPGPKCCTSDFTLAEIKTMCAKMDAADSRATTRAGYVSGGVAPFRTNLYSYECPQVPTHKEYIQHVKKFGGKYVPELKTPSGVVMPYNYSGVIFTQTDYAQKAVDEYIELNIDPSIVYLQSFLWSDVIYWATKTDFKNACALEGTYDVYNWSTEQIKSWLQPLKDAGVPIVAPPLYLLANRTSATGPIAVSNYANIVLGMGFKIVTWSYERDGPLKNGGGFYHTGLSATRDGFDYEFLDFMVKKANITGIFSDWPATVTFYANCMGVGL